MDSEKRTKNLPSKQVSDVAWRIFGEGESPFKARTSYDLVGPVVRAQPAPFETTSVGSEIARWFDAQNGSVKSQCRELAAVAILDGARNAVAALRTPEDAERMFWAVGWIDPDVALPIIHSSWSREEIDAFANAAIDVLDSLARSNNVLDAKRILRIDRGRPQAMVSDTARDRRIDALRHLRGTYFDLYAGVAKTVHLLAALNSDYFYALVNRIDHPYLQVLAADVVTERAAVDSGFSPVDWIKDTASDNLVRLAIIHTLEKINESDSQIRRREDAAIDEDDFGPNGTRVLQDLVERLKLLGPIRRTCVVFELLNDSRHSLNSYSRDIGPLRYQQLRKMCVDLLVQLTTERWSDELVDELRSGLELNDLSPLTLPLAELAWELREECPERASMIFWIILDLLDERVKRSITIRQRLYYSLTQWQQRECILGFGVALAALCGDLDLTEWVSNKCRALPLSVWHAEEDHELFTVADGAAQLIFLVAFHAIDVGNSNDIPIDPQIVRSLAELHWLHCQFAESYPGTRLDEMHPAEYSARVAAIYGEPSDTWMLNQAKDKKIHLRTLWALFDQHAAKGQSRVKGGNDIGDVFVQRLTNIIADRCPDVNKLNLFDLHHLGMLWLLLGAGDQAANTAMAIIAHLRTRADRPHRILALKLLAFAASTRSTDFEAQTQTNQLYRELWPTKSTRHEELNERRAIDAFSAGST